MNTLSKNHHAHRPYPIIPNQLHTQDWRYQLMDLSQETLLEKIKDMPRETLIEWLAWNDVHGIFSDEDSISEGYEPLTKEQAAICVFVVIMRHRESWNGYMGDKYVKDMDLAVSTEI